MHSSLHAYLGHTFQGHMTDSGVQVFEDRDMFPAGASILADPALFVLHAILLNQDA
jgi:hypothetical protein